MSSRNSYAKGRAKRQEILEVALRSLAEGPATLADIAQAAGVTRSTLLYHFTSREELFAEVVRWRDEVDKLRAPPEGLLYGFVPLARHNAGVPGLVQVFATLSAEATTPDHAAHEYFVDRYSSLTERLTAEVARAQADGSVTAAADPAVLAQLYIAAMDGLQVQHLYDGSVDMHAAMATLLGLLTQGGTEPAHDDAERGTEPAHDDAERGTEPAQDDAERPQTL